MQAQPPIGGAPVFMGLVRAARAWAIVPCRPCNAHPHSPLHNIHHPTVSGWYIGNILFGGLIGMIGVDLATGGMYVFPDSVTGSPDASAPAKGSSLPATLMIVATDALCEEQMRGARLVATAH